MTAEHESEPEETPGAAPYGRTTLTTTFPQLRLVELTPDDARAYYDLVDRNRDHLTQHGNYLDLGGGHAGITGSRVERSGKSQYPLRRLAE